MDLPPRESLVASQQKPACMNRRGSIAVSSLQARNVHVTFRPLGLLRPLGPPKLGRRTSLLRRSFWNLSLDVLSKNPPA